jgi:hypothetical protein
MERVYWGVLFLRISFVDFCVGVFCCRIRKHRRLKHCKRHLTPENMADACDITGYTTIHYGAATRKFHSLIL